MGKTYRKEDHSDPRMDKQKTKLSKKEQGRQAKDFMRQWSAKA